MVQGILGIVVLMQLFIVALMMQLFIDGCVLSLVCVVLRCVVVEGRCGGEW